MEVGGDVVAVTLVGVGTPRKSMGWWHAVQLLEGRVSHARLATVLEPYFMGEGSSAAAETGFSAWRARAEADHHVQCKGVRSLLPAGTPRFFIAFIGWLLCGCAACYYELVAKGFKTIFIEKPGASNVAELSAMAEHAAAFGVSLAIGFMRKSVSRKLAPSSRSTYRNEHRHARKRPRQRAAPSCLSRITTPSSQLNSTSALPDVQRACSWRWYDATRLRYYRKPSNLGLVRPRMKLKICTPFCWARARRLMHHVVRQGATRRS
eukprot:5089999-Pleurochrysis_carterae.AAC.1